jgi:hypothetical protein
MLTAPVDVRAADHLDSASVKVVGKEMADINDVYAWMTTDAANLNLALTVSPADDGTRAFGPTIQYVFHIEEHPQFGMAGTERRLICTFATNTSGQCWLTDSAGATIDYVSGDLSAGAGKISGSNKMRVYAGRRSDPFFFNLSGFLTAKRTVNNATLAAHTPDKGCPDMTATPTVPATLRTQLAATPVDTSTENGPCPLNVKDCFASFNVMAIVVQIDKSLVVSSANKYVSVWASTHATP